MISQFGSTLICIHPCVSGQLLFNFHERLNPEDAAKARVEILHREMGDELFEQYAKQTIYLAEHTEEGDACPGHMTCRAGQSSFCR